MKNLFLAILFIMPFLSYSVNAQEFKSEITAFKQLDSIQFPAKHQILLVGSSSFRKWTHVQEWFPNHIIINRGFGGSTLPDVIHYANEIIFPYAPKQILIYCGENDIASSDTLSAQNILARYQQLFFLIRAKMKRVEIDFVSIKPSPVRAKFRPTVALSNQLIKAFIATQKHAAFINIFDPMLNQDGSTKQEIFLADNLHMNDKGYAIWQKIIAPYLMK